MAFNPSPAHAAASPSGAWRDKGKERARWNCFGKQALPSAAVARDAAQRVSRKYSRQVGFFRCGHCSAWHVGTSVAKTDRARLQRRLDAEDGGGFA